MNSSSQQSTITARHKMRDLSNECNSPEFGLANHETRGQFSRRQPKRRGKLPKKREDEGFCLVSVTSYARTGKLICISSLLLLLQCCCWSKFGLALEMAPRITIQPNDLIAIEGESAELNCDAEGQPEPTIEWYHNGQLIRSSTHSRTTMGGSIQFLDIRPASPASAKKPTDTGTYYCLARNSLGQARSKNASLQVAYIKQEFRTVPKDNLVAIGETATFDCLPQAWPEPRIKWRHNGRLIELNEANQNGPQMNDENGDPMSQKYSINKIAKTTSELNGNNKSPSSDTNSGSSVASTVGDPQLIDVFGSQLVIRRVDKNDEGKYSCLVETKGSHRLIERESPSAQLIASVKPYFIEAPEHKTIQVGGQVKLRCRIGGDPEPVISWRKQNGQPLSEKAQIDPVEKTLTFDQVSVTDQGTYVCEGENSIGSVRSMATVSVNSRPKFIIQPEDQEVDLGSKVQMKCVGEASPHPMLFWYKEGHRQLMFAPGATGMSSKQIPNDWQAQPLASMFSTSDIRGQGGSMATSDTSPAINKLFSMPINLDQIYTPPSAGSTGYSNNYFGNRIYVDNQGTLNIINVTSSDNGYYACALISSVGSVMGKAKLTIRQSTNNNQMGAHDYFDPLDPNSAKASGNLQNSKFDLLPPPVIKLGAANQTLPTDVSATLVCEVVSQVAYKIQWFFESQPLQEEAPRVTVLDTGALNINNLKTSDSGIYTCLVTAANDQTLSMASPFEPLDSSMLTSAPPVQQSTSHSTMLKVADVRNPNIQFFRMDPYKYPSSPGPAYLVSTNGNDAITIAWVAPTDSGNLPIKEYIVEHYDTSQEHLGWRVIYRIKGKESLLIDGLSSEGSHFFVIRAANGHGVGPSSAIAGPIRTVAGETRYQAELQKRRLLSESGRRQNFDTNLSTNMRMDTNLARERLNLITTNLLSLTPLSSSSIRLQWSIQVTGNLSNIPTMDTMSGMNFPLPNGINVDDFIEGYSIRYRALGLGESLLSKDPFLGAKWSVWPNRDLTPPSSLPLVTSYIESDEDSQTLPRSKRDLMNYFDYSQFEFNEVRVVDHNTESYTINGLRPFTLYQFFVVPYYKDIDGTPSNHLQAQTNEDRPAIAPPNLTVRPINNTAVRLLWLHLPPQYANGILRGYVARVNRSDILNDGQQNGPSLQQPEAPKMIYLPLGSLSVAPFTGFNSGPPLSSNSIKQYIVMHDLTNLTYKSFYSIQVAAYTSVGSGLWSESQNFIMDPKVLSELKVFGNDFDDVMSKSLISSSPQSYGNLNASTPISWKIYLIVSMTVLALSFVLASVYLLYRRNNQKVITWKKTISEHFNNKFYMPAAVDHQEPNSMQPNIYDHQQHLIYSDPTQLVQQTTLPAQALWASNEYEELDPQQSNTIMAIANADRHQTASSNSDTSCPSSVTRLLPNHNYNRELSSKTFGEKQRHEMVLQQQVYSNDGKQPFATMINGDNSRLQTVVPLSPYATTNLMNQTSMPSQYPQNFQTSLINHSRQHNFVLHNGGVHTTMDDSSTALLHHNKQINGVHNPMSVFRTSQRQPRQQFASQAQRPQVFMQTDNGGMRFYNQQQDHNHQQQQNLELGPYQSELVIYKPQSALQHETDSPN